MIMPDGINRTKTVSQKRFHLKKFHSVENKFNFTTFHPKKPILSSKKFPILNTTELLSIASLPKCVSKLRLEFGSYVPYSQGPKSSIDQIDVPVSGFESSDNA